MKSMRILQICNYLHPHIGGIEQITRNIAKVVHERGMDQMILCFNEDASADGLVCRRHETAEDEIDGVRVVRCGTAAKIRSQSISFAFHRELKKAIRDFQPDTVIFHYPNPWEAASLLRELPEETRLILYWHLDIVKQKLLGKLFTKQNTALIARAETIVATSPLYIDGSPWLRGAREKCVVIPNSIGEDGLTLSPGIRAEAERIRREAAGRTICFAAGRHVPYKGIRYLVEASRRLDDGFVIRIAGRGEETDMLKQMAAGDPKVLFLGRVPDEELKANLLAADIFCFPSVTKNEAFGIALAEAMYYGKPAVTFHIPGSGVNYVSLKDVTGLEVENADAEAYAEAIRKLAGDPALREKMGSAARSRVEENFLFAQFREHINALLDGETRRKAR